MENKGLYAIMGILLLALGFSTGFAVAPSENVILNNVTDTEYVYVNNTVEVAVQDKDIFDKVYSSEIAVLELNASAAFDYEFDNGKDFEDFVEETITGFDKLKTNLSVEDFDEEEIKVMNLGLEDEEEILVKVYREYKIKYEDENSYRDLKATVIVEGTITFDEDDKFEANLVYSLK